MRVLVTLKWCILQLGHIFQTICEYRLLFVFLRAFQQIIYDLLPINIYSFIVYFIFELNFETKKYICLTIINFGTKFGPLIDFSVRRSSYHFKAYECKSMRAFDLFQLLNKYMFNGTLKIHFY